MVIEAHLAHQHLAMPEDEGDGGVAEAESGEGTAGCLMADHATVRAMQAA